VRNSLLQLTRALRLRESLGCLWVLLLITACARAQGSATSREPHLPGAVIKAPSWLANVPFDVKAFFDLPPASQNAASLYLDAFFDLDEKMAVCFPPPQTRRTSIAMANGDRIDRLYAAWDRERDPAHLDRAGIDSLMVAMRPALQKLDVA
jgi:hypothetical protein